MKENNKINIFIVEDNEIFAMSLKAKLETTFSDKPTQFYLFETGETCMEGFRDIKPEIVILDYTLNSKFPDAADGIKVLDWIKNENKETFVVMLTANDNIETAIKSFQHNASDYIVKTETGFEKITFSLVNFFEIIKNRNEAAEYLKELNKYKENYIP